MATPLGRKVFFRNKETMSQCNSQNLEPVIVKNLVIHFDQEKFEELLSGGSPVLHALKYRKVSVTKTLIATEQKPALTGQATGQTSSQLPQPQPRLKVPHARLDRFPVSLKLCFPSRCGGRAESSVRSFRRSSSTTSPITRRQR